jgi:hypothetical protein
MDNFSYVESEKISKNYPLSSISLMLQRFREWLTLILLCLLPFHAFLVTVGTKMILGPGHAPLSVLALWKEGFLALVVLLVVVEIIIRSFRTDSATSVWSFDLLDWLILLGLILASTVSFDPASFAKSGGFLPSLSQFRFGEADRRFLYGIKYDFLPLVVFFFLRRVTWSTEWVRRTLIGLVIIAFIIAVYGILSILFPSSWFTFLGYSDMHSLYIPSGPLAAFQQIEGLAIRRIQSVMSGPNQLGLWLLLPLSILLSMGVHAVDTHLSGGRPLRVFLVLFWGASCVFLLSAMMLTYSRTAWIAACVMSVGLLLMLVAHLHSTKRVRRFFFAFLLCVVLGGAVLAVNVVKLYPALFVRDQSLSGHIEKPLQALKIIQEHPFGLGLGTAGPASNALSDTCVFLPLGTDYSWAKDRTDLCVFVGGTRRLPAGRSCDCPLLTENWYLQWGVEMGIAGLLLSLLLPFLVLWKLLKADQLSPVLRRSVFLAFLGVSIGGLFLHAFEDSATAYTLWVLLAVALMYPDRRATMGNG